MNTVLITAGIDGFSTRFHHFPSNPVAIIELDDWTLAQKFKVNARRFLNVVQPNRFTTLRSYCQQHGFKHYAIPRHRKQQIEDVLKTTAADLVVTYRCPIIPTRYLHSLSHGAINLHASLLPDFRGGDPLFWQVMHGVVETGVTVHQLTDQMDAGPILHQVRVNRPSYVSEQVLWDLLNVNHGFDAICHTIRRLQLQNSESVPQPTRVDAKPAPNGARSQWRSLATQMNLSADARKDVACFLGESFAESDAVVG